jgi:hypothetical protein
LFAPVVFVDKKKTALIGGLGLVNPLIEIIYLACALVSLCGYPD